MVEFFMKLNELKSGQSARIIDMSELSTDIRKKLMIMGMLPNTQVKLIRKAPLGDPLQIEVRGVSLAIRGKIASEIAIEVEA